MRQAAVAFAVSLSVCFAQGPQGASDVIRLDGVPSATLFSSILNPSAGSLDESRNVSVMIGGAGEFLLPRGASYFPTTGRAQAPGSPDGSSLVLPDSVKNPLLIGNFSCGTGVGCISSPDGAPLTGLLVSGVVSAGGTFSLSSTAPLFGVDGQAQARDSLLGSSIVLPVSVKDLPLAGNFSCGAGAGCAISPAGAPSAAFLVSGVVSAGGTFSLSNSAPYFGVDGQAQAPGSLSGFSIALPGSVKDLPIVGNFSCGALAGCIIPPASAPLAALLVSGVVSAGGTFSLSNSGPSFGVDGQAQAPGSLGSSIVLPSTVSGLPLVGDLSCGAGAGCIIASGGAPSTAFLVSGVGGDTSAFSLSASTSYLTADGRAQVSDLVYRPDPGNASIGWLPHGQVSYGSQSPNIFQNVGGSVEVNFYNCAFVSAGDHVVQGTDPDLLLKNIFDLDGGGRRIKSWALTY